MDEQAAPAPESLPKHSEPSGESTTGVGPVRSLPVGKSGGSTEKAVQKIGKIVVDRELCIGAASCLALAPETFELDEENKAVIKNPKGHDDETTLAAAVSCPTNAIFLYNEDGEQIHPPK